MRSREIPLGVSNLWEKGHVFGRNIRPVWETHQVQSRATVGNTSTSEPYGKKVNFAMPHPSADGQRLIHYAEQQPAVVLSAIANP